MDYSKAVMSLFSKLQKNGVTISRVFDGESWEEINTTNDLSMRRFATEIVTSVDTSTVLIQHKEESAILHIVLGNDEHEILADWGCKPGTTIDSIIEKVEEEFSLQWE